MAHDPEKCAACRAIRKQNPEAWAKWERKFPALLCRARKYIETKL